ncbi:Outer membrane protein transport protein (OMPP1/FadL/TodX) [Oceaniovalibus guishaninsula JLT2003]|uniref:Outer membrane protein transport protein (OMPP1/FadL/TodX) n=1 Tax=Oceaniovalibus guishaninsula JLT2003 TaxID=1231392 RepID=K2HKQ6_9RHOB|nr:outer membrane protein transport protein [Oceaniovalibus guishaninsula]EKE43504.1 Outer membrane protein transport protein (OMPP1/FadL/TodX) [Oceaniovalibus guishaninsula JLT2003]
MKTFLGSAAAIALCPLMAHAIGLDRSAQNIDILFEDGNYAQLSFGRFFPDVSGTDLPQPLGPVTSPGGARSGNVADDFNNVALGLKYDFNDRLSMAVILDQPYGVDVHYDEGKSVRFGGTEVAVDSRAITALLRYKFDDNWSVHGGLRYQEIEADVRLRGLAYGLPFAGAPTTLNGYRGEFGSDGDLGYVIGAAYEMPEIALRVALTYNSKTTHDLRTSESVNGIDIATLTGGAFGDSVTEVEAPEAVNLDFQTGIAPDTLLFGSLRYAWYDDTKVSPDFFAQATDGDSLTSIENNWGGTIGIGRRLSEKLSGSVAFGYDARESNDLVSPLAPTNGSRSLALGLSYDVSEAINLAGGVRYIWINDARPETGDDVARARFEDNDATAVGFSIGYRF